GDRLPRNQPAPAPAAQPDATLALRCRISHRRVRTTRPNQQRYRLGGAGGAVAAPLPRRTVPAPLDVPTAVERSTVPGAVRGDEMTPGRGRSRAVEGGPHALRALALLVQLSIVASYNGLHAQCPDGSTPPCRVQPAGAAPAP